MNRVDYWQSAICEAIFELDFASSDAAMHAQLCQYDLGLLKLSDVSISSAHRVSRSCRAVARDRSPRFNLNYVRAGSWQVDHYGRQVDVAAGDLVLVDNRQPYTVTAQEGTLHMAVHLPVDWIQCWLSRPEDAVARPIRVGDPWHATLTATLHETLDLGQEDDSIRAMCVQQIGGALALALGRSDSRQSSHTRGIYRRILAAIQGSFFDHQLDASKIAAAVAISGRYLHKILAQEGTTYVRELFRVRLEHARAMLCDPRFGDLSVSEIGWRCGFCDPSHFSRRFKGFFGISPGSFRVQGGTIAVVTADMH